MIEKIVQYSQRITDAISFLWAEITLKPARLKTPKE